jgi:hypothetical protein
LQAQTPQQRKANEKYARSEAAKRGKPESAVKAKKIAEKSPISNIWIGKELLCCEMLSDISIGILVFVLCGGVLFELLRLFF